MVKTIQAATELTYEEIEAIKKASGKDTVKDALQDAVEYRIAHPVKVKKVKVIVNEEVMSTELVEPDESEVG